MDYKNVPENINVNIPSSNASLPPSTSDTNSLGPQSGATLGRPAAANAARERSRVQTLRHAFLELQRTLPSVPPDTKLSKLDVLLLATTYIAHLTRSLQDEEELPGKDSVVLHKHFDSGNPKLDTQFTNTLLQIAPFPPGYAQIYPIGK
uniref:Transcription factor 24 n=1 Tax=Naja naja TaxID=35670 RepID=A0A8C6XFJ9_NAJNA